MGLRARASERCTTTVVVENYPEVVVPHLLHLTQLAEKSQISQRRQSNLANQWK
jgi:hypothetical protein